ncbi:AraC family transcriptional regulator [Granulicoccus sp. GXG6511]|uniref:AraC family transcriptional regulator n=1 Tax=Granulicoccus sp. GXG6511 TaxID=3381351 RepID=UPI003D7F0EFE
MPEIRHYESTLPESVHVLRHREHTPAHSHDQGHLVYPAAGVLSLATPHGSWIAPPNRAIWIPAGSEHQHHAHGTTDMRIVFMSDEQADLLPDRPMVLVMTALACEAVLRLTGGGVRSLEARDRLRLVTIDDLSAAPEQPLHLPQPTDDRLREVTRIVERELDSPATLRDLGRRVGAGERTLSRLFRSETGMTFPQWRTQLRIHSALLLLADGVSVLDTALACGWANPSGFIEIFTLMVGQSPGRYQRSLMGSGESP